MFSILFNEVQKMRAVRTTNPLTIRSDAQIYSLSRITKCAECGSTLRVFKGRGRPRLACNGRIKNGKCSQSSTCLDIYEKQLVTYLSAFHIPVGYQEKIVEAHKQLYSAYDVEKQKNSLKARLEKLKELSEWGHKTKSEYFSEYAALERELKQLPGEQPENGSLAKLASFLGNIVKAWEDSMPEQRNRLLKCLFEVIWIKDKRIIAVTPRPEYKPFFDLNY